MSDYSYDATDVSLDRHGAARQSLIPNGKYQFRITEATPSKSAKGHFMVVLKCEIINDLTLMGRGVKHWVTFLPPENKAAGMAIHFLKTIGQPWEGKFDITVADWIGSEFTGSVKSEPYVSKKDGKTYESAKIDSIEAVSEVPF